MPSKSKRSKNKQQREQRATAKAREATKRSAANKKTMGAQQIPEPFQKIETPKFRPRITTDSPSLKAALEEDRKRRSQGMDSVVVHEYGKWRARTPTPPQDSSGTKGKRKKRGTRKRKRRRTKSSKKRKTRR